MTKELFEEFKQYLKTGIIDFTYRKVNGEIRNARGTTDMKYIEERGGAPNGTGYDAPSYILRYWDVNSEGWRSCKIDNIESFIKPDATQKEIGF